MAAGTIFQLDHSLRTFGAMELRVDSASDAALGDNRCRWCPSWGASWDISRHLRTEPFLQYDHSFAERPGVKEERKLEVHLPLTVVLPDDWSLTLEYKPELHCEKSGTWNNIVRAGVSKHLKKRPIVLNLSYEQPLYGDTRECKVLLTLTRYLD
jgi:hypothetical protein